MTGRFETIALFGRPHTEGIDEILGGIGQWLEQRGLKVLVLHDRPLRQCIRPAQRCDLGIVVGGDGTMLGVARTLASTGLPLVGINLGRLGFITDIPFAQWKGALSAILDGDFDAEDRALLDALVTRRGRPIYRSAALNDVVISRSSRAGMIEVEVSVDGLFMYSQRADGLIVSTPTGSTAYSLSAHGPILHPSLGGIVLVPVAPQSLSNRPIVLPDSSRIVMTMVDGKFPRVNCDMQSFAGLHIGDQVEVVRSTHAIRFLHPAGYSYYATLRSKLNWHEMPHMKPKNA